MCDISEQAFAYKTANGISDNSVLLELKFNIGEGNLHDTHNSVAVKYIKSDLSLSFVQHLKLLWYMFCPNTCVSVPVCCG
jgi:hypothetical protein